MASDRVGSEKLITQSPTSNPVVLVDSEGGADSSTKAGHNMGQQEKQLMLGLTGQLKKKGGVSRIGQGSLLVGSKNVKSNIERKVTKPVASRKEICSDKQLQKALSKLTQNSQEGAAELVKEDQTRGVIETP
ncbi:hypothetical protein TSUD_28610 [Trifolium subterraneum]|uniref:Uncharacterized protein n=1 Tax=Trifolium subterraneum TaxID=3900 RepID=A0A2Z6P460_TRISU|nr:hypothetical protein TSUD_28610 [Trifolium subterraneum]